MSRGAIFFAGIIMGFFSLAMMIPYVDKSLYDFSKDQGSTIAAFVTLGALVMAWLIHTREIAAQEKRVSEERDRNRLYFKAKMNDASSQLVKFAQGCYQYVYYDSLKPTEPSESIEVFKEAIKYEQKDTLIALEMLVQKYQIYNSRIFSPLNTKATNYKDSNATDLVKFIAFLHRFLDYARGRDYKNKVIREVGIEEFDMNEIVSAVRTLLGDDFSISGPSVEIIHLFEEGIYSRKMD